MCVSPQTLTTFCLNISRIGDGVIDCLGAADEQAYCRTLTGIWNMRYRCRNSDHCTFLDHQAVPGHDCRAEDTNYTEANALRLLSTFWLLNPPYSHFGLNSLPLTVTSQSFEQTRSSSSEKSALHDSYLSPVTNSFPKTMDARTLNSQEAWLCNRGILILKGFDRKQSCLCPQSYYGDRCQYQSDRVSLTLQFRRDAAPDDIREVFTVVIALLDNTGVIHSIDYITYLPRTTCNAKFNRYLLYDSQPKDRTKNYTVRVDAYNRLNVVHYASWLLPVKFAFLPVNRMAFHLTIPVRQTSLSKECRFTCIHGYCTKYVNELELPYYCQCYSGWSGARCTIPLSCTCAEGSLCTGVTRNRSICVCLPQQIGPRCFLRSSCLASTCKNGGVCVPADERSSLRDNFTCVCPKGFWGVNCELTETKITISFASEVKIPLFIMAHFITVNKNADPTRLTTVKKIPIDFDEVTLSVSNLTSISHTIVGVPVNARMELHAFRTIAIVLLKLCALVSNAIMAVSVNFQPAG
ncbi:hypothetical protein I4U23_005572 [Adineta vaga]|nr:hypothetical protein I4U23_005572 [Adineta vaga]